jgi:hypothetical protein
LPALIAITPRALIGGKRQQLVQRAALLERGGELQVLELEEQPGAGQARQGAALDAGGVLDRAGDLLRRRTDVVDRYHVAL